MDASILGKNKYIINKNVWKKKRKLWVCFVLAYLLFCQFGIQQTRTKDCLGVTHRRPV